jgi:hypothetical protein
MSLHIIIFVYLDPPPRCDSGWIANNRSCYRMFQRAITWGAAKRACRDTGGHLVRIDNDNEQYFLSNYVRPKRQVRQIIKLCKL